MVMLLLTFIVSCDENSNNDIIPKDQVSEETLAKLKTLGYNTDNFEVHKLNGKLIVENDILLKLDELDEMVEASKVPVVEHFRTQELVTPRSRAIKIFIDESFGSKRQKYIDAARIAVNRYNAENLTLTFLLENDNSNLGSGAFRIKITASPDEYYQEGILGSAGFPTSNGDPHNEIEMTREFYDNVQNINGLATTMAHEIGHCIGFRHTDLAWRWTSCGSFNGWPIEPDGIHIPGTPKEDDGDINSWMMACGGVEVNRPFTASDVKALNYLY